MNLRRAIILASLGASGLAFAGPEGGEVTGGGGSISAAGNTTTVNQHTERMVVEWQSYSLFVGKHLNIYAKTSKKRD